MLALWSRDEGSKSRKDLSVFCLNSSIYNMQNWGFCDAKTINYYLELE